MNRARIGKLTRDVPGIGARAGDFLLSDGEAAALVRLPSTAPADTRPGDVVVPMAGGAGVLRMLDVTEVERHAPGMLARLPSALASDEAEGGADAGR